MSFIAQRVQNFQSQVAGGTPELSLITDTTSSFEGSSTGDGSAIFDSSTISLFLLFFLVVGVGFQFLRNTNKGTNEPAGYGWDRHDDNHPDADGIN